jgi:16S rRNA (guanine527-N7)-methyltransferase
MHIVDVGAGAGFPGIPLAVFLDECRFTLCERKAVRSAFLRNACLLLHLKHVEVQEQDLKEIRGCFDIAVFRAFSEITDLLPDLNRVVKKSGIIFAYKGRLQKLIPELTGLSAYFKHVEIKKLNVPFLGAERHVLIARMRDAPA